jgi:hypothetical protein
MDTARERERLLRWLARPDAYPHRPDRIEHIETHISDVFLAARRRLSRTSSRHACSRARTVEKSRKSYLTGFFNL